jgi:hypothetical protein
MIKGYSGQTVFDLLNNNKILDNWQSLYDACNWATVYQNPQYVNIWYKLYSKKCTPLLILEHRDENITGVFPLAITSRGKIVGAGHTQAEYQTWICQESDQESFFGKCLEWIRHNFPNSTLHLKYLPHQIRFNDLMRLNDTLRKSIWRSYHQPIMVLDEKWLSDELSGKHIRKKINGLKRLGEFKFERITDYNCFLSVFDDCILQSDFRKGALFAEEFFNQDKSKKEFISQLFKAGLFHVTILQVGNEIIASNGSMYGKNIIHLQGFNSIAPQYSKYTPGIIRYLMLGQLAKREGFTEIDLTPGRDNYKAQLTNKSQTVYELCITSNQKRIFLSWANNSSNIIKSLWPDRFELPKIHKLKLNTNEIIHKISTGKTNNPFNYFKLIKFQIEPLKNSIQYLIQVKSITLQTYKSKASPCKNNLRDLLMFSQNGTVMTRRKFLWDAMKRLEVGQNVYTLVQSNRLKACLWHVPENNSVDYNTHAKATSSIIFLVAYDAIEFNDLKNFVSQSLINIFNSDPMIDKVVIKINKNGYAIDELVDNSIFEINSMNILND